MVIHTISKCLSPFIIITCTFLTSFHPRKSGYASHSFHMLKLNHLLKEESHNEPAEANVKYNEIYIKYVVSNNNANVEKKNKILD